MTREETLVSVLINDSAVSNLVGTRIVPAAQRGTLSMPYVLYLRIGQEDTKGLGGTHTDKETQFRLHCWSSTYSDCIPLADAVQNALTAAEGDEFKQVTIQSVYDSPDDVSEAYQRIIDVNIA